MKDLSLTQVLIVSVILTAFPILFVKFNSFRKVYRYEGKVIDAVDGFPIDLIELQGGGQLTYTNRNGLFVMESNRQISSISSSPTVDFEADSSNISCRLKQKTWSKQSFTCEETLYPQSFNIAERVLIDLIGQSNQTAEAARVRKEQLWRYLSSNSQKIWGSQKYFADLMMPFEETNRRLKKLPLSFRVEKTFKKVSDFRYFGVDLSRQDVVSVRASFNYLGGGVLVQDFYFVKENKVWKYLIPESPASVIDFDQKNIWVFQKK